MSFDALAIKKLQPGEKKTFPEYPGLRLEVSNSNRSWIYRYKSPLSGIMKQIKIGMWPAISWHAAVVEWEKLRAIKDAGKCPSTERKETRDVERSHEEQQKLNSAAECYTVAALCDEYYRGHVVHSLKPDGVKQIAYYFSTVLGEFGSTPAAEVGRKAAFDFVQSFASKPAKARKIKSFLGSAWDYALDAGHLPDTSANWWRQVLKGKLKSLGKIIDGKNMGTAKRFLSDQELSTLIPWLPNFTPNIADALTLYLWTGTRGSEIVQMLGVEITEKDGVVWWTVPKIKTKNARHKNATDLRVPLLGRALEIVQRRKALHGNGFLFPSKAVDGHLEQSAVMQGVHHRQPYNRIRPNSGRARLSITHWSPHDLRRTARTQLASLGCPSEVAEAILGHMQPGICGVYNQYGYDKERVEWLGKLSHKLEQLASNP